MAKETKIRRVKANDDAKISQKVEKAPKISKYKAKKEGIETKKSKKPLPKWLRILLFPFTLVFGILAFIFKPFRKIFAPIGEYFAGAWHELKLVRWPTRKETWKMTGAVIAFAIVFGILILGLDAFYNWIFNAIIKK